MLNHNGGELTIECLRRLPRPSGPPTQLEIVLVDNALDRRRRRQVRDELPRVRIIDERPNLGFAGGCNLALRDLDDVDYVALLNNDVLVEPGWLEPLVHALGPEPTLGAACPKILFAPRYSGSTLRSAAPTGPVEVTGGGSVCG